MASQDARLSKFEANFKQQQGEMTNKIDTVLKVITDRITGALPSDTVENPKLNVNFTSPVSPARSYPVEDPQCSTRIHSSINAIIIYPKQPSKPHDDRPGEKEIAKTGATDKDHHAIVRVESERKKSEEEEQEEEGDNENINTDSPSQPDPSISFITEKVCKLNSFLEISSLVPQSSDTEFVCTKGDDGDIMFIEIIKKYDDSREEKLREDGNAATGGPEVEYFNTFPTMSKLAYHKYLMCGLTPSLFLRNPIITEGFPSNLKIPCNIRHVHVQKSYIDLNSPLNIMTRMMYNWIMRRKLDPSKDTSIGVSNFTGSIKGMHIFVGNFTYNADFMIVEDII
ncbi:hypothetical protein Tco_0886958 [Tanacetum coccineum]